jgi:Protein of unknown function (DUF1579)
MPQRSPILSYEDASMKRAVLAVGVLMVFVCGVRVAGAQAPVMTPGEQHKVFAKMAGKWTGRMKVWSSAAPTAPPLEATEETETRVILGGRFAYEEAKGSMMGMPMQRVSILGYDNYRKVYTLVFYSSMGTATNTATGGFDAAGKVLTLRGEFDEPDGRTPFKNVIRIESDDVHVFESYRIHPDGKELKLIEEIFTRVK